jgi:hypothetical protein
VEIRARQASIGRDPDCDLALADDATVSRRHALLQWEAGRWMLRDLGSKNGTRLLPGGDPVEGQGRPIVPGQSFLVGSASIELGAITPVARESVDQLRIVREESELVFELATQRAAVSHARAAFRAEEAAACQRALHVKVVANAAGAADTDDTHVARACREFARLLMPPSISDELAVSQAPLSLLLDPALLDYPWEMLPCGGDALGLLRPVSRMVLLRDAPRRAGRLGRRLLIVANPTGDLATLHEAAEDLLHTLAQHYGLWQTRFLAGKRATRAQVLAALDAADALVYLGHAHHRTADSAPGGWQLADGPLTAEHFAALGAVPALVLACACASARTDPAGTETLRFSVENTGVAETLLLSGVQQFFGTLWPVSAVSGTAFAAVLLDTLLEGQAAGAAMLHARRTLRGRAAQGLLDYGAYVHYGRPDWQFPGASE